MASITLDAQKLRHNYRHLDQLFQDHHIEWSIVTKLLCGTDVFLKEVVDLGNPTLCDSRVNNLKKIKRINPDVTTVYIKPPAKKNIDAIVKWADVSFNTELVTIQWLNESAQAQNRKHRIIIMIELGDLREGVMGDQLMEFYQSVFQLENIEVIGIGANLNCLHGVMPSQDKMIQLSLYKQLIEAKFNVTIPYVSGGTSVMIPLIMRSQLPQSINHFRIGETLFFGVDLFNEGEVLEGMYPDVFEVQAQIIELTEKPVIPNGVLEKNPSGEEFEINEDDYGKLAYRAIIDLGLLDINPQFLLPKDAEMEISGASSDMLILDLGENPNQLKVGDHVVFDVKYMGALGLLNSYYIEKKVINR